MQMLSAGITCSVLRRMNARMVITTVILYQSNALIWTHTLQATSVSVPPVIVRSIIVVCPSVVRAVCAAAVCVPMSASATLVMWARTAAYNVYAMVIPTVSPVSAWTSVWSVIITQWESSVRSVNPSLWAILARVTPVSLAWSIVMDIRMFVLPMMLIQLCLI